MKLQEIILDLIGITIAGIIATSAILSHTERQEQIQAQKAHTEMVRHRMDQIIQIQVLDTKINMKRAETEANKWSNAK